MHHMLPTLRVREQLTHLPTGKGRKVRKKTTIKSILSFFSFSHHFLQLEPVADRP